MITVESNLEARRSTDWHLLTCNGLMNKDAFRRFAQNWRTKASEQYSMFLWREVLDKEYRLATRIFRLGYQRRSQEFNLFPILELNVDV